ncbi:arginine--tRNA ligase [Desulfovibrio intestinalis]|uniref:Arginine--tRNA ligase n=1 Tax=Desulfovibrio intestinalis TaxID=58621 RepID=A0A7W8C0D6_9BACT|nr:arginine--tRNA ligase [Desulfovibrio intestinalis]MBB5143276.1 arginyl-tRNA synthetase [Desulfovibrio intestinalis]
MRAIETLRTALAAIIEEEGLAWPVKTVIEPPRDPRHGDLSVNSAMLLAKEAKTNPRELAQKFAQKLQERCPDVEKAEAAGPGFCNVTFSQAFWRETVADIESAGQSYGESKEPGRKVLIEYVSANPTGPLHVGHGRGAAVGDSLTRLLRKAGHHVHTEYYINDAGRQMRLLGLSVWLRALELAGRPVEWPEDYYKGDYIIDIAREMLEANPGLPDMPAAEGEDMCYDKAMNDILNGIKDDLRDFRVEHLRWFSEKTLVENGAVDAAFAALGKSGYTYDKDNAFWFATEQLGDDKNRVLKKSDGTLTYFASDIAYHHDKFERGFDWLIDIWGADHHGYIPRMRAAITAMGKDQSSFDVVLIQLVNLLREGQPVSMSTRAGTFETLSDVIKEVGTDAARFMFLSRKSDSPLDFDLELAKQRSMDNPVYYVQYAHARICAVLRRAAERGFDLPVKTDAALLASLDTSEDMALLRKVAGFEDMLGSAAQSLGVHHVSHYLTELAGLLHSYYAKHQVLLADDAPRTLARLALLRSVGQVVRNGLDVLGVSAPESM